jgi:hypothetical protein
MRIMRSTMPEGKPTAWRYPMRASSRFAASAILAGFILAAAAPGHACTIFTLVRNGVVLVGNNEDYHNPDTRMWFVPSDGKTYGVVFFGYDNLNGRRLFPQGGMNDRGLFFDANALSFKEVRSGRGRPVFDGDLMAAVLKTCATVREAVAMIGRYDFSEGFSRGQFQLADASGDAVVLEGDASIPIRDGVLVSTNFRQSDNPGGAGCHRFNPARRLLAAAPEATVDACLDVLETTAWMTTQYSQVFDLRNRVVHLYHFHDFARPLVVDVEAELRKGAHVVNIPALFPRKEEFETFVAKPDRDFWDGTFTILRRDGRPATRIAYVRNAVHGKFTMWNPDGTLMNEWEFENGVYKKPPGKSKREAE